MSRDSQGGQLMCHRRPAGGEHDEGGADEHRPRRQCRRPRGDSHTPRGGGEKAHGEALYEYDKYPEDETEKDLERHVAAPMRRHWKNFLEMIETRGRPVSDIEEGYITATSCILANLSCQLGRTLHWDPKKGRVIGDDEANGLLARPYRAPWVHPDPQRI